MFSRIKNWANRTIWRTACWLAATQGYNLNRAIYIGPQPVVLAGEEFLLGNRIHGAAIGFKYSDKGTLQTVFNAVETTQ